MGTDITWVGQGVEEHGHVKDEPENVVVRVDPRYFRPTEVELLLVSTSTVYLIACFLSFLSHTGFLSGGGGRVWRKNYEVRNMIFVWSLLSLFRDGHLCGLCTGSLMLTLMYRLIYGDMSMVSTIN